MGIPDISIISQVLLPEFFIVLGILLALLFSAIGKHKYVWLSSMLALAFALLQLVTVQLPATFSHAQEATGPINIIFDSFVFDTLSVFFRILIYAVTLLICLASSKYMSTVESPGEYYSILLTAALGGSFLTGANDFLVLFVAIETLGLSSILLASYARKSNNSNEAGIKYLFTSAVATSMLLLAISFVYGLTGATNFVEANSTLSSLSSAGFISNPLIALISVLFIGAVGFKLSAAPFHNWAPDVYSGAPTTTTLFLSVVSKVAAFGLAIRLFTSVFQSDIFSALIAAAAVISIVVGNYIGVVQILNRASVKRLLAYSSIAQAGYLMIGLAVASEQSLSALVFYLTVYAVMNTGAFLAMIYFEQEAQTDEIYELSGLVQKKPLTTAVFSLCLINLAGLPFIPAGFIGKFFLFSSAYSSSLWFGKWIAVIGLLGSVVALFFYLYLVKIMIVDSPSTSVRALTSTTADNRSFVAVLEDNAIQTAIILSFAALIYIGVFNTDFFTRMAASVVSGIGV